MTRPGVWVLPLVVLAGAVLLRVSDAGFAPRAANVLFDAYQRFVPRPYQDPRSNTGYAVRYVDIDAPSLARYGAWPWPRALLARIVEHLHRGGAFLVVLTMPLSDPDSVGRARLLDSLPSGPEGDEAKKSLAALPDGDLSLARALNEANAVTGFVLTSAAVARSPNLKSRVTATGPGALENRIVHFTSADGAMAAVENASEGVGALNLVRDPDGGLRRLPMVFSWNGRLVASLDAEVLRLINNEAELRLRTHKASDGLVGTPNGIAGVESGTAIIPTTADGRVWIYFGRQREERRLSAARVLEGEVAAGDLSGAIVYVGSGNDAPLATAQGDRRTQAAIRAEAMEQILLGQFLRRPAAAEQGEILFLLVAGAVVILLLRRKGVVWAGAAAVLLAGGVVFFSWHMFETRQILFDSAYPVLVLALIYGAGLAFHLNSIAIERDRLQRTFAQVLPAPALGFVAGRSAQRLAGETREMSYLACRVRGFSKLSEIFADDPQGFSRLMKRVMTPLSDAVVSHRGALDRVAPGALSAFFNAPLDDPDHAVHACECALKMVAALEKINRSLEQERRPDGTPVGPVGIGIGVNTGLGAVGDFGTAARPEYTVAGRAAALAPEIEALSDRYGPAIIVGEATRKAAERNFAFLEVDALASSTEPIKLYALLGNPLVRAGPKFRALQTFHDHIFQSYRAQQWSKAKALIEQCRTLSGASQELYDLYLKRIAYFEANPPGPDWDGTFRAPLA
ncbi:MAG: CHASE2 domain-containing protein [Alphaproteobacteria bacterium]